jgi:murein DD-endopeptidase MepM/ murein hydrolase activator NlpD
MKFCFACFIACLPLKNLHLNSTFGYRVHPLTGRQAFHAGIDLKARKDTVFAIMDGRVAAAGFNHGLGWYIRISHGEIDSEYGHLSRVFVLPGTSVTAGEPVGITGATGRVTGEHLHFSVSYHHKYLNPIHFLYQLFIKQQHHE